MGRARVNFPDLKAPPTWRCGQRRPPAKPASLRAPDLNSAYPRSRRSQTQDWEPAPPKPLKSALPGSRRSEEHTSELQSLTNLVCRLLLEKKKKYTYIKQDTTI